MPVWLNKFRGSTGEEVGSENGLLVEQWMEDPRVGGSNPSRATIFKPEGR